MENTHIEIEKLAEIVNNGELKLWLQPEFEDDDWHLRYQWEFKPESGKQMECDWRGFEKFEDCYADVVDKTKPYIELCRKQQASQ